MNDSINIYCDESGHLEHDMSNVMVLGSLCCPTQYSRAASLMIKKIKEKHGLMRTFEMKWTKISPAKIDFYLEIVNYFCADRQLRFRAVIIPDKSVLRHSDFQQTHDVWYYKMYYTLLGFMVKSESHFKIYLDYKDTWGAKKVKKLHEILKSANHDYPASYIDRIQLVHSDEVQLIQLADILIGATAYANRELSSSTAKLKIIDLIQKKTNTSLIKTTSLSSTKINILRWHPKGEN